MSGVVIVAGIAVMCFLLYQIKESLETLVDRVSRIEERLN